MKKVILFTAGICFFECLSAQVKQASTSLVKQQQKSAETNISKKQQVPTASIIKLASPVTDGLVLYKWKASRWIQNAITSGFISSPDFVFHSNGTVNCSAFIIGEAGQLSGTYLVNGDAVTISLKKDTSATLTLNLTYDKTTQKLNGTYNYQVLVGYAAGNTSQGAAKMEINPG